MTPMLCRPAQFSFSVKLKTEKNMTLTPTVYSNIAILSFTLFLLLHSVDWLAACHFEVISIDLPKKGSDRFGCVRIKIRWDGIAYSTYYFHSSLIGNYRFNFLTVRMTTSHRIDDTKLAWLFVTVKLQLWAIRYPKNIYEILQSRVLCIIRSSHNMMIGYYGWNGWNPEIEPNFHWLRHYVAFQAQAPAKYKYK